MKLNENEKVIFNGTNYVQWKPAAQLYLMSAGLAGTIQTIVKLEKESESDFAGREKTERAAKLASADNLKAIGIIGRLVDKAYQKTVLSYSYAYEVWDYFEKNYSPGGNTENKTVTKRAFYNYSLGKGDGIAEFLANLDEGKSVLGISDDEIHEFIFEVNGGPLPDDWNPWLSTIKENESLKTWMNLRLKLEREGLARGYNGVNRVKSAMEVKKKHYSKGECYNCGGNGHYARECHEEKSAEQTKYEASLKNKTKAKPKNGKTASSVDRKKRGFVLSVEPEVKVMSVRASAADRREWKYDTGATDHCTPYDGILSDYRKLESPQYLNTAKENEKMAIAGIGSLVFKTPSGEDAILTEVLHVPSLSKNLLSGPALSAKGCDTNLTESSISIENGEVVLMKGRFDDRSWMIDLEYTNRKSALEITRGVKILPNDEMLKHARLGHPHDEKGRLDGCNACDVSKATQLKYSKEKKPTMKKGCVSVDLLGPVYGQYIGTCVYHDSDETAALVLNHKSDFFDEFVELAELWETQYERRIKMIYCDNGGEFINRDMQNWAKSKGIIMNTTNPFAHQQNGLVERRNRTLTTMAKAMMAHANLPSEDYSMYAYETAAYLLNRKVSKRIGMSPYEVRTGDKPDLSTLRVFGCRAYVHVPKEQRRKMDSAAIEGIMVGYSHNGYHVQTRDGRVLRSRNVKFEEYHFGFHDGDEDSSDDDVGTSVAKADNEDLTEENDDGSELGNVEPPVSMVDVDSIRDDLESEEDNTQKEVDTSIVPGGFPDSPLPKMPRSATRDMRVSQNNIVTARRLRPKVSYADAVLSKPRYAFAVYADKTMKEALKTSEADEWVHGIEREYQNLIEMGTFAEVKAPKGRKLVGTKLIMHRKADGRYRPRLVVQGFSQIQGLDYFDTYAPVAGYPVFRLVLALAAANNLEIRTYDVGNAFVNAPMNEEIYVKIPEGYEEYGRQFMKPENCNNDYNCLRLLMSLYGTKQAAYNWYTYFSDTFKEMGFKISKHEQGLYFLRNGSMLIIVANWVDDFLYCFPRGSKDALEIISKLEQKYKLKRTSDTLLGLELHMDKERIVLSQKSYIERKAAEFGLDGDNCAKVYSPMETNLQLVPATTCDERPYLQLIGSLMHSMTSLRFDIAFPVGVLARYGNAHDESHWNAALRVLQYLYTTRDYSLNYEIGNNLLLQGYSDADFGSDSSGRSTTGMVLTLGNCAFLWKSKIQSCVTLSTAEAETVAACETAVQIMWVRNILMELGYEVGKTPLWEDNNAAIAIATKPERRSRIRHMHVKHMYLQEKVADGDIEVLKIDTELQLADLFTKALAKHKVLKFCKLLGLERIPNRGSVSLLQPCRDESMKGGRGRVEATLGQLQAS
jgi:hypothetical protein